jgi:hypothetical protein
MPEACHRPKAKMFPCIGKYSHAAIWLVRFDSNDGLQDRTLRRRGGEKLSGVHAIITLDAKSIP